MFPTAEMCFQDRRERVDERNPCRHVRVTHGSEVPTWQDAQNGVLLAKSNTGPQNHSAFSGSAAARTR